MNFVILEDYKVKIKEIKKTDKYFDLARELRKLWSRGVMVILIVTSMFRKRAGRVGDQRMNSDHQDCSIVKINQNTEKSPGDLRRLAVTRTSLKDHQLTLTGKTNKENINNDNLMVHSYMVSIIPIQY